ncbi:MAG: tRNA (adenosine(37)-N6)-threonylcarbamoyltransferase complex transferase subunit TsaD [Patescibacteria group bacterium]
MTKILSIETSCDETSLAILDWCNKNEFELLSHLTHSQIALHRKYGGVYPSLARREHQKNIMPLLFSALKESGLLEARTKPKELSAVDKKAIHAILERDPEIAEKIITLAEQYKKPLLKAIAVTYGPGLEIALWTGFNTARALAHIWDITLIPTNHMEGHIYASLIQKIKSKNNDSYALKQIAYPSLAVLISGGHTELVRIDDKHRYTIIGETLDDAVGEAFDKSARLLGLPYPGGPEISRQADLARLLGSRAPKWGLPRPMIHSGDYNFSFSGLKTAVRRAVESRARISKKFKQELALEFEEAVAEVLIHKTRQAIGAYDVQNLIVGGGVSANAYLREQFQTLADEYSISLYLPDLSLSGDNALMINLAGYQRFIHKKYPSSITRVDGNLAL